jgi:hypothetical protein
MKEIQDERDRAGFVGSAVEAFGFLGAYGFHLADQSLTHLRYESPSSFLTVYHGRSSYQVGLELGLLDRDEKFSLHELLSVFAPGEVELARFQTREPNALAEHLSRLAGVVAGSLEPLLQGDPSAFERLRSQVAVSRTAVTLRAQYGAVIDRADEAWEAKDMDLAESLYEKSRPALDGSRIRRLEYLLAKRGPKE